LPDDFVAERAVAVAREQKHVPANCPAQQIQFAVAVEVPGS
jgi:hypothetical protein